LDDYCPIVFAVQSYIQDENLLLMSSEGQQTQALAANVAQYVLAFLNMLKMSMVKTIMQAAW
jgi:hypothetical protein